MARRASAGIGGAFCPNTSTAEINKRTGNRKRRMTPPDYGARPSRVYRLAPELADSFRIHQRGTAVGESGSPVLCSVIWKRRKSHNARRAAVLDVLITTCPPESMVSIL